MPQPAAGEGKLDRQLIELAIVVLLGASLSILDTTVVNVALQTLGHDLHASLSSIQWVVTGYMLTLAMAIPLSGWAVDRFGPKRLWMASVACFLIGSALCGLSTSAGQLIFFRLVQGVGGGLLMPVGMSMLATHAGPQRMGRVMGFIGVPMLLAPVVGPVLGGWLVSDVSWRAIFYINIPIGLIALIAAWKILPADQPDHTHKLDWIGFGLLSPGLALVVYGLADAASKGGFGDPLTSALTVLGLVLCAAFVWHARGREGALLDLSLFGSSTFRASSATTFALGASLFGAMILLPLYFQIARGATALQAGLLLAPQGVGAAALMPVAGRWADRRGPGTPVLLGLGLATVSALALTQVGAHTSYVVICLVLLVRGASIALAMMPAMAAAYATLNRAQVPRATGTLNIVQRVGGALGSALLAIALQKRLEAHLPHLAGKLTGVSAQAAHKLPAPIATAVSHAFSDTFWLVLAIAAIALIPAWWLRKAPAASSLGPEPIGME